jgi:hypothetical protein
LKCVRLDSLLFASVGECHEHMSADRCSVVIQAFNFSIQYSKELLIRYALSRLAAE